MKSYHYVENHISNHLAGLFAGYREYKRNLKKGARPSKSYHYVENHISNHLALFMENIKEILRMGHVQRWKPDPREPGIIFHVLYQLFVLLTGVAKIFFSIYFQNSGFRLEKKVLINWLYIMIFVHLKCYR